MKNKNSTSPKRHRSRRRNRPKLSDRLRHIEPAFSAFHIEEPKLVFGGGNLNVDPRAGLLEYGPIDGTRRPNGTVQIAAIGTSDSIQSFLGFLGKCDQGISCGLNSRGKPVDPLTFPDFPGATEEGSVFRTSFVSNAQALHRTIHSELFANAIKPEDVSKKIENVVDLVFKELQALAQVDPAPDVVVIILPPEVYHEIGHVGNIFAKQKRKLTPKERFQKKIRKEEEKTGQASFDFIFDEPEESDGSGSYFNVHHCLKARAMELGLPTQLIWDHTFRDPLLSSVAWNMLNAIYYKAGNIPWRLQSLPDNTCFVGISFFKESPHADADMQTSLAQVFGAGEGIVLRGERAVVDPDKGDRSPHLTRFGAERVLKEAIAQYTLQHGGAPTRVVVHKSSRYWDEELEGFRAALGEIYHYDFLTLEKMGTRFLRVGERPVLRGTMIQLAERRYLLFTSGYVPYLRSYPNKRIPRPIEILEHHGDSTGLAVCQEILALTKLNWNSCCFASSLPITLRFSRDVGRIISAVDPKNYNKLQSRYRYFM